MQFSNRISELHLKWTGTSYKSLANDAHIKYSNRDQVVDHEEG